MHRILNRPARGLRLARGASSRPDPVHSFLSDRPGRAGALFPGRRALISLALCALAGPSLAQGAFHVSTTSDAVGGGLARIDDAALVTAGRATALPFFVEGHWQGALGWVPSDVDAFGRDPSATPGSAESMVFSIQSNEGGFRDGDVLGFGPGGQLVVHTSEDELLLQLGVPAANIDVDALDFGLSGCLYFSLQSDLTGTVLGTVSDGDVLCYDPSWGTVGVILSEADVQSCYTAATGSVAAVGDVIALEEFQGELWVVPQSPSAYDGAVLACSGAPRVIADETQMGLGGAELDALSVALPADEIPCFVFDTEAASAGDPVRVTLYGKPNTTYVALMSGGTGWIDFSMRPGFGAFFFDPLDPWLNALLGQPGPANAMTDGSGRFSVDWAMPSSSVSGLGFLGEAGWSFQMFELPSLELSAPFRVVEL